MHTILQLSSLLSSYCFAEMKRQQNKNFHSQFSYVTNHSDHILIYIPIKLLMAAICNKFL